MHRDWNFFLVFNSTDFEPKEIRLFLKEVNDWNSTHTGERVTRNCLSLREELNTTK
jgi:hypothetical protein